jgi:hypothetical protein
MGDPEAVAWIQEALDFEKSMLPPLQLEQLPHRMLAVIVLPSTPEPSSRLISAEDEREGVTCPEAVRGETVTLVPSAD